MVEASRWENVVAGRGVGEVVGRNVDRLDGRDRALLRRGDPLLELAQLRGQVGLVADGRGHPAEEGRNFGAGLGEAEDVVDEEEDVLVHLVAEIFGDGKRRQPDPEAGSRRLGHLAVDQGRLVDDLGLLHLEPEVVALARPLADAGEHGVAAVLHGHVVDELQDDDGLAHAGAAEEPDLAALERRAG